jgi:hypothetical protein
MSGLTFAPKTVPSDVIEIRKYSNDKYLHKVHSNFVAIKVLTTGSIWY